MKSIGYFLLAMVMVVYLGLMIVGFIAAFPFGLIGLVALAGIGFLLLHVLVEKSGNAEDRFYEENVDK